METVGNLKEIWSRKSLIRIFAISDLMIRYRNSVLGFFWSILEPLLMLSVLYLVFTNVFKSQIESYPLYLLLGLITWNFFARSTGMSLNSIIGRAGIVTKIYIPREILPISACITGFIMMMLEFIIFAVFVVAFRFMPPVSIFVLPGLLLLEFVLVLGISFFLSVLNVRFRDLQSIWNLLLYAGFFFTPVFYSLNTFPSQVKNFLLANPMAQILEMIHNTVLYGAAPDPLALSYISIFSVVVLVVGYTVFRLYESQIVEEL
jgi:lipopolysaccharide transport system permease protein